MNARIWSAWAFATIAIIAGLGGFALSFPGWLEELGAGHPGCVFAERDGAVVIDRAGWEGAPCEPWVGAAVRTVDGQQVTAAWVKDRTRWEGQPSTVHQWGITRADGAVSEIKVEYEQGPLAQTLGAAGNARGDLLVVLFALGGVAMRTWACLVVVLPLLSVARSLPSAVVVASSLVTLALGLGFDSPHASASYDRWRDVAEICVAIGLATALVVVPRGRRNHIASAILGLVWFSGRNVVDHLPPGSLPDGFAVQFDLAYGVAVIGLLATRARRVRTPSARSQLTFLAGAAAVLLVGSLPLAFDVLPPAVAEFHVDAMLPVMTAPLPLALAQALVPYESWDLGRRVRMTLLTTVGGVVVLVAMLVAVEIGPRVATLMPFATGLTEVEFSAGIFLAMCLFGRQVWRLVSLAVDNVLLPHQGFATYAVSCAADALGDCGDAAGVAWCARAMLRSGFDTEGRVLVRSPQGWTELLAGPVKVPAEVEALEKDEGLRLPSDEDPSVTDLYLPLRYGGKWLGVLHCKASGTSGYSPWDEAQLRTALPAFGEALWRAMVSGGRSRALTDTSIVEIPG